MSKPTLKMTHGAIGEAMCCYTDGSYKDADIALTEYENSIRADERRKFIDFMAEHTNCRTDCENFLCYDGKRCWNKYLDMYEKEQRNENI